MDNTEDNRSFRIEFESVLLSFEIISFKLNLKIAFRGTVSEFDETSSIGSVILNYYRISNFRSDQCWCVSVLYINTLEFILQIRCLVLQKGYLLHTIEILSCEIVMI